jgi:HEPN domain-containing protein
MDKNLDVNKIVTHWLESAEKDFVTMNHLFDSKDYSWSLFIGHIVLEKVLKARVVEKLKKHAPFTHDLTKLSILTGLDFSEEQLDWLDTITTFNLNARYDSYKQAFYKKCTPDFSEFWISKVKELYSWIKRKP